MGIRGYLGAGCFGAALLAATACLAATIEPIKGDLSINRGQGFEKVEGVTEAKEGDAVMVGPDGLASISFPDGCQVNIQPGTVVTIAPLSPCASGAFAQAPPPPGGPFGGAGTWGFGAGVLGTTGFVAYEIFHVHHQSTTPPPASP